MGTLLPAGGQPPFDAVLARKLGTRGTHHGVFKATVTDEALEDLLDINFVCIAVATLLALF